MPTPANATSGVHFPPSMTGSALFREALATACVAFPDALDGVAVPTDNQAFKSKLSETVVRFEARRADSARRTDIARNLVDTLDTHTRFGEAGQPLSASLQPGTAHCHEVTGHGPVGWTPEITYRDQHYRGAAIAELADRMREDYQLTDEAAAALRWVAKELLHEPVNLSGQTFALLGAGAELAPTPYLLQAGARVVWVDTKPATELAERPDTFAGTLVQYVGASDLLSSPCAIYQALGNEADNAPLHLGLYAYAPGRGRELRLTAAMNGITSKLPDDALRSVAMLISPTTPGATSPTCLADSAARLEAAPRWQHMLSRARLLSTDSHHRAGQTEISRSIVPLQGPTYLAAQYLAKMMVAEVWAADRPGVRISANVAGITHTQSLSHPLFLAGFAGAPVFGIEVYTPPQTRVLMALLMLHDALRPDDVVVPPATRAIHGGVRTAPFRFWDIIQVAAVVGVGKKPSVLLAGRR